MSIDPLSPDFTNTPVAAQRPKFEYESAFLAGQPAVSLITPYYNTGPIFHETARSVLQQSLQQWEWIIVNDGSRREAGAVLDRYREVDPRIRVIDLETNRGLPAARNIAFRLAASDCVAQLDSDDLLEPTALEKWRWFLESYPEFSFVKGYSLGFGAQEYLWSKGFEDASSFLKGNQTNANCMIRKSVHTRVGGYDETLRTGFEDWDFWLRCGSQGAWGATIPEYLDWYRRRRSHKDRWAAWDGAHAQQAFLESCRRKYPNLWHKGFPKITRRWQMPSETVPDHLPFENRLSKRRPRLVMLLPWLTLGGADRFNLDLVQQLTRRGWDITIVTTAQGDHSWLPQFARSTPDIFVLNHFLRLVDYPRFLRYLIQSRAADVVLLSNSELSYHLLPYLRAHFPQLALVDMCHMEEEAWKNGGYSQLAVLYQELLNLNLVSSQHLRDWMVGRGADAQKIRTLYTCIDTDANRPRPERRTVQRNKLYIRPSSVVILYAARLVEQKQPRVLAHTLRALRQRQVDVVTLIAGDGPLGPWLRNYLRQHDLEGRVRFLGALAPDRVRELFTAADIFFLPSQMEGIALSIYEAMAHGLPVVGAAVGGQAELVTPECGVLIERSDEDTEGRQYAEILAGLALSRDRRQRMGAAARKRVVANFPISHMVRELTDLLSESQCLARNHPAPSPSLGLARASAAQAVEYVRLFNLAEHLWSERNGPVISRRKFGLPVITLRRSTVYFGMRRSLLPIYQWGLRQGWAWPQQLKEAVKDLFIS